MPNRPICAEDALLSETPMPPEQILRYLDRIGLRDAVPPPPTLETLRRLQSAHLLHVPYENLDLLRGAITSLEHGALFEKIVEKRRGGLCFELNGLFCWLLCSLGYQVTSYAGRFIYPSEAGIQMRRHRVLVVTLEGKRYLTETGMNSEGPARACAGRERSAMGRRDGIPLFPRRLLGLGPVETVAGRSLAPAVWLYRGTAARHRLYYAQPFLRRASDVAFQQNGAGLYFFTGCSFVTARQQADMVS